MRTSWSTGSCPSTSCPGSGSRGIYETSSRMSLKFSSSVISDPVPSPILLSSDSTYSWSVMTGTIGSTAYWVPWRATLGPLGFPSFVCHFAGQLIDGCLELGGGEHFQCCLELCINLWLTWESGGVLVLTGSLGSSGKGVLLVWRPPRLSSG